VDEYYGGLIFDSWRKFKPFIEESRSATGRESLYEWFSGNKLHAIFSRAWNRDQLYCASNGLRLTLNPFRQTMVRTRHVADTSDRMCYQVPDYSASSSKRRIDSFSRPKVFMFLRGAFVLGVLVAVLPSSASGQQWSSAQTDVWAAVKRGWEALRVEDVDAFMATLHPQFLGWNMVREVPLDFAAERSGTVAFLAEYDWVSYEIEPVAIRVVGDEAVAHYRYREVVRKTGDATVHEEKGRATQVLKRQQGGWKTLTIMSGATTP
jgi:ketosteroid isomerase-like protein